MWAAVRRYEGITDPAEAGLRVDESFIPLLEQHGLMRQVDRWVVARVAQWAPRAARASAGMRAPRCTLNLSPDTLPDVGFAAHVRPRGRADLIRSIRSTRPRAPGTRALRWRATRTW